MRIVLVGPPGAGKGTQAHFIASHLAIPRISTGDIFRYNVANNTELGVKAKEYMDRGDLVPDAVTVAMVRDRLAEADAKAGFLLDGFPRNVPQAETLKKMLAELDTRLTVVRLSSSSTRERSSGGCPVAAPAGAASGSGTVPYEAAHRAGRLRRLRR